MKRFCNQRDTIVGEAIDGLLRSSYGRNLYRLEGYDNVHVVLRRDWDKTKVAIISGGGSGHEPAHAGFVGEGMLTAAVCGALFASPGVDAILAAIMAVTGEAGCLLIVKNYTGDRLNFGLAAEQARGLGFKVEMVIVGDDIALDHGKNARGLAGTLIVQKIAGDAARQGKSLEAVTALAREVQDATRSFALALTDCNVFDSDHKPRLAEDEAELGLGIHGEPGAERIKMAPLNDLVRQVSDRLASALSDGPQIVLINMLGAVPVIEAQAIVEAFAHTKLAHRVTWIVGPAPMMTSLDMVGFSLTALPARERFVEGILADVEPQAWPKAAAFGKIETCQAPRLPETFTDEPSRDAFLEELIQRGAQILIENEKELNALDARIGDGDAGSTFADAARQLLKDMDKLPLGSPQALCATLGRSLARHSGGSSGVLLSIMFATAGGEKDWRTGLERGVSRMQDYGGASLGDRTMLDALIPAIEALRNGGGLAEAASAARKGADRTREMKAGAGRAAYVPEDQLRTIPDPGAVAIARLLEGLATKAA